MASQTKLGTYNIPSKFKDEDKWFKFFTLPQLFAIVATLLVVYGVYSIFSAFGMKFFGVFFGVLVLEVGLALIYLPIPSDKYLIGGGQKFRTIVLRIIIKKMPSKRVIYTKNYNRRKR